MNLDKIKNWKYVENLGVLRFSRTSFIFIIVIPILLKATEKFVNPLILKISDREYIFQLELPFNWFYLYFGAIAISLGSLIYLIFCPQIIKEFDNYGEFEVTGKPDNYLLKYLKTFDDIHFSDVKKFESPYTRIEAIEENIHHTRRTHKQDGSIEKTNPKRAVLKGYSKNLKYYEDRRNLFNDIYLRANQRYGFMIIVSQLLYYVGFILIGIILVQNLLYIISYLLNG